MHVVSFSHDNPCCSTLALAGKRRHRRRFLIQCIAIGLNYFQAALRVVRLRKELTDNYLWIFK